MNSFVNNWVWNNQSLLNSSCRRYISIKPKIFTIKILSEIPQYILLVNKTCKCSIIKAIALKSHWIFYSQNNDPLNGVTVKSRRRNRRRRRRRISYISLWLDRWKGDSNYCIFIFIGFEHFTSKKNIASHAFLANNIICSSAIRNDVCSLHCNFSHFVVVVIWALFLCFSLFVTHFQSREKNVFRDTSSVTWHRTKNPSCKWYAGYPSDMYYRLNFMFTYVAHTASRQQLV